MKVLKILRKLLKSEYEKQPLFFGVQESIEKIELIHEAIEELEKLKKLNSRSCDSCKHLSSREKDINNYLQEVCRTCTRNNNDNWESK